MHNTTSSSSTPSSMGGARRKRSQSRRNRMRGGMGASEWQMANVGTGNQQWDNVFVKGGPFGAAVQNLAGTQPSVVAGGFPSASNLSLIQSAGSKRSKKQRGGMNCSKRGGSRTKRGGYWGKVLTQALVPFTLLFAQNRFGTRKHRK